MTIGFDAKRAFENSTGLGHYSRTLIEALAEFYPANRYKLFAPELSAKFKFEKLPNTSAITPNTFFGKVFSTRWRNKSVSHRIEKEKADIFHGLSNQLPAGIRNERVKTVVTVHDLIFEKFPAHYGPVNVRLHRKKMKQACRDADAIIAISGNTKKDLQELYGVDEKKISVCYQSCDSIYQKTVSETQKRIIRQKYELPPRFWLYVGSVTKRKNLLAICGAMAINATLKIPLVVIGSGRTYKRRVQKYISRNLPAGSVIFLSDKETAETPGFRNSADFPAIYQQALALIYPSFYEGFGIPILEAMESGTPVIASNTSCMPETGGDAVLYAAPNDPADLAKKMQSIENDPLLRFGLVQSGYQQAKKFSRAQSAASVMNVYQSLL